MCVVGEGREGEWGEQGQRGRGVVEERQRMRRCEGEENGRGGVKERQKDEEV